MRSTDNGGDGARVLLLISSLMGGGAERVAVNLANDWVRQGKVVKVVTLDSTSSDFYTLDQRVGRAALELMNPSAGPLRTIGNSLARIQAIRRELSTFRPEVAIGFMTVSSVLLAISALGLGCRTVGTERSHPPATPLGPARELARQLSYGALDVVLALTDQSAKWIRDNTFARRVEVIPNAARWPLLVQDPVVSPSTVCKTGREIVLAVGRLDPVKGYPDLFEVFARLAPRFPGWDLVVLGEGAERARLEEELRRRQLEQRVFMPGIVGNVSDWYQRSSLYVMTSKFEGFPNTLVEAMSCGLASVSMDCDVGPRNIIRNGIDGVLVQNGSLDALERELDALMRNADLRSRYGTRAVEVRERFGHAQILAQWNNLIQGLIAGTSRRRPT